MLNASGIILCDDVFVKKLQKTDKYYYSNSTIETLNELENVNVLIFHYSTKEQIN